MAADGSRSNSGIRNVPSRQLLLRVGTGNEIARSFLDCSEEEMMGRGLLLWMLGVPIPVILLLWLFFGR